MEDVFAIAKAHHGELNSQELMSVEVPEWKGSDGNPVHIYHKRSLNVRQFKPVVEYHRSGDIEKLADVLVLVALNPDGTKMFKGDQREQLVLLIDGSILHRVVGEIVGNIMASHLTMEEAEKN